MLTQGSGAYSSTQLTALMQLASNNSVGISAMKYSSFYCFANIEHMALFIRAGGGGVREPR